MKMKYLLYLIHLFYFSQAIASNEKMNDKIYARADYWCPYNCSHEDENPGYLIEILQLAFGKNQIKYETMNWARAISETRSGTYDIVIGAAKNDTPDFPLSLPVGQSQNCFYTDEKSKIKYKDVKSLEKLKLGVAKNYSYFTELDEYVAKNITNEEKVNESFGDNVLEKMVTKLIKKEIDIFVENPFVVQYFLKKNQNLPIKIKNVGCTKITKIYFAFAPNKKETTARVLKVNKKIKEMIQTKEMEKLIKKYGVTKWY